MLALAARRMGYRVHVFSPGRDTPTGQVADREYSASYADLDAVREFARSVDVVTYEFENVPADTAAACAEFVPVHPGVEALHVAQNRLREKQFCVDNGLPVTPFARVTSLAELRAAVGEIGCPAVLKTAVSGYDGKGQVKLSHPDDAELVWNSVSVPAVLEGFVNFEREVSVVAARGANGEFAHYGLIENRHEHHILDVSIAPAPVKSSIAETAVDMARRVLEALDVVGVLCVEFFLTRDGALLVNEIAPRPHNSGHLTVDACVTSQFEQQLRAVCGLPLGAPNMLRPAAMANLLGDLWRDGRPPDWTAVTCYPNVKLHLYGKQVAQHGRKMGHLTVLADTAAEAVRTVLTARDALANSRRREEQ